MNNSMTIANITPADEDVVARPFWSVMIPTYNPRLDYLRETIESVLTQDLGPAQMQIEVLDDCSSQVDVTEMVRGIAGLRIVVSRTPKNLGLAGCWNMCIEKSKGHWVHILHQDDAVLPGFYEKLGRAIAEHPDVGLVASRSFMVDDQGIIDQVTARLPSLENGGRKVTDFYYGTPFQCPGVVVKRGAYETVGGFRSDLKYALDCEMWARIISEIGGLVLPEVLARYRCASESESTQLWKTAEALSDIAALNQLFAERYPGFDLNKANRVMSERALSQAERLTELDDHEAAGVVRRYWRKHTSMRLRLEHATLNALRRLTKTLITSYNIPVN